MIDSSRVSNPGFAADSDRMVQGHELDGDGMTIAIHVQKSHPYRIRSAPSTVWTRYPIWAPDGSRMVVHRRASARPEAIRTVGSAAPVMLDLRMLAKTTEAWAIAKRIQSSYALLIKTDDPEAAARSDRYGAALSGKVPIKPGMRYYHNHEEVKPMDFNFQGNDYEMFRNPIIEAICAAEGVAYEMVLKRLTKSNLASSRAALLVSYEFARREQNQQIASCEYWMVDGILREAVALGNLEPNADWDRMMSGRGQRPPRVWPDPLKEAMAAKAWIDLGASKSRMFAEHGMDHEQETLQKSRDLKLEDAQGLGANPDPESTKQRDRSFVERVANAQEVIRQTGAESLTWPAVIAASAATTAPGAYLQAMAGNVPADQPPEAPADPADPEDPPADPEDPEDLDEDPEEDPPEPDDVLASDAEGRPTLYRAAGRVIRARYHADGTALHHEIFKAAS
jgi:capsid protein